MALKKVKFASVYYENTKIAEMQSNTYDFDTGDSQEPTDEGMQFCDGITTAKLTCETLIPTSGLAAPIFDDAINKRTVTMRVGLVSGKIHSMDARLKSGSVKSEVQSGKQTGGFEWMCGNIRISQ